MIEEENLDSMEEFPDMYGKGTKDKPDISKPAMFLRVGAKGGLYFFSPKKHNIYYLNRRHVKELMEGKRDFAVIHKAPVRGEREQ